MNRRDSDPQETQEWLDAFRAVVAADGRERGGYLLRQLSDQAGQLGINLPQGINTPYRNTIPADRQTPSTADQAIEHRIRSYIRWNAAVMVIRANRAHPGLGGHIATFASAATLYDTGFNHFFHGPDSENGGDLLFIQGHSSPGIYARAFLEGRLDESQLDNFRREINRDGLSSYPHPRLMPEFWQFPTVSMGLSPIMGIYQAHFMKYMKNRKLADTRGRKIWVFLGDGEMDEPESIGAISLAGREQLDNLIFVINCNLQRLDGPVRGNGKIIQELEGLFRGAHWNVIKVIWGSYWDPLFEKDEKGLLLKRMEEVVDGDYQNYQAKDGAYIREHFFSKYPELLEMVSHLSDEEIWRLNRGGHDPHKVYAAYHAATRHEGQPSVILAKTVKGYGMGESGEGQNKSHQQKKMDIESLKTMRDRFKLPLTDDQVERLEYIRPQPDTPEHRYLRERRAALGGFMPQRRGHFQARPLSVPGLDTLSPLLEDGGDRQFSTTMAFVRILTLLCRDKQLGRHIVPIVPDEARTFGMEGLFRTLGIYSSVGQLYQPQDADQVMVYKEDRSGQILEEAICEAGAFSSWLAAATSYEVHGVNMVPFYIFYSMFGFQRVGDLTWAAGDMQARGFLMGGTAGRTTLAGEGLQHQDGHSHVLASVVPNCIAYDPCFGYELAVIIHEGLEQMVGKQEDVFFYITLMNENYAHPALPEGAQEGIIRGLYCLARCDRPAVRLLGSGAILRECIAAQALLQDDWNIRAEVWSVTSFTELARDGRRAARWNRLHPGAAPRTPWIAQCLQDDGAPPAPVVAASDYLHTHAEQVRAYIEAPCYTLGTDGFGRSDTREQLRDFFEVDRRHIAVAALNALAQAGAAGIGAEQVRQAIARYRIEADRPSPDLA